MVPIMFPVAGKAVSDIGRAASSVKSKMAAMIAEQFVQSYQVISQNNANIKTCYISSGGERASVSVGSNNSKNEYLSCVHTSDFCLTFYVGDKIGRAFKRATFDLDNVNLI